MADSHFPNAETVIGRKRLEDGTLIEVRVIGADPVELSEHARAMLRTADVVAEEQRRRRRQECLYCGRVLEPNAMCALVALGELPPHARSLPCARVPMPRKVKA